MDKLDQLHQLAIADNISWCSVVCNAHASDEDILSSAWINLKPSPPFYPNIITREPNAQTSVFGLIERIRMLDFPEGWGIKDSFCDLALDHQGFEKILSGSWFGGVAPVPVRSSANFPAHWKKVASSDELLQWEIAWGGDRERRIFPDALLADARIEFWKMCPSDAIEAGFICFHSGLSIGLSNWFFADDRPVGEIGALEIIRLRFPGLPVVFWSSDDELADGNGVIRLGPLQVWISKR